MGIIDELVRWIENPSKKHGVCFVHGGAGVGKSALAQTICEIARRKSQLAASFFFWRNDNSDRSSLDPFFATIAHQLATLAELEAAGLSRLIKSAVERKPNGFVQMTFEEQLQEFIRGPCGQIDPEKWKTLPKLVVIDGFDECMGGLGTKNAFEAQETLLTIINNATSCDSPIPLQFMIFSRPEPTIFDFFQSTLPHYPVDMRKFNSEANRDIRKYIRKQFDRLSKSRPEVGIWPGEEVLEKLVDKADGHFIYVVTAMKYITNNNPSLSELQERLDTVLHTERTTSHPDLSDLDQLYHTILQRFAKDQLRLRLVLQLILTPHPSAIQHINPSYESLEPLIARSQHVVAMLLKIELHQCSALLSQLRSVLHVPEDPHKQDVTILHASFSDFLREKRRSLEFHVRPLHLISYLDLFSCLLLSILRRNIERHQRREQMGPLTFGNRGLEVWSLKPWSIVEIVLNAGEWMKDHRPSDELLSAAVGFDLYGYLNMMLDP